MNLKSLFGSVLIVIIGLPGLSFARGVSAATISFSPADGAYTVGQSIQVKVVVDSTEQAINAQAGTISWPAAVLKFQSASLDESINQYWVTQPKLQTEGSLVFSGGLPTPGFIGVTGTIMTINFTTLAVGTAILSLSGVSILANDGGGLEISDGPGQALFKVTNNTSADNTSSSESLFRSAPVVTSTSHPQSKGWSRQADVQFGWTKPNGLLGVSYSATQSPETIPDEIVDSNGSSANVSLTVDGRWYLHVRGSYDSGWSAASHYPIQLDRTEPETFTPKIVQDRGSSDPTPELTFATTDAGSGVIKYTYRLDDGLAVEATNPVSLSEVLAGVHTMTVMAFDAAGNTRTESIQFEVQGHNAPIIGSIPKSLFLFETLNIRGLALLGDQITIFVNGLVIGQVVAGPTDAQTPADVVVRVPWSFSTDQPFRPGSMTVTATAASLEGQTSVTTDPHIIRINGQVIKFLGRPLASFSVLTPLAVFIISLLLVILAIIARLILAVWKMHRHQDTAERELESLREVNRRQPINQQQLDSVLWQIEEDLGQGLAKRQTAAKRRPKKNSR